GVGRGSGTGHRPVKKREIARTIAHGHESGRVEVRRLPVPETHMGTDRLRQMLAKWDRRGSSRTRSCNRRAVATHSRYADCGLTYTHICSTMSVGGRRGTMRATDQTACGRRGQGVRGTSLRTTLVSAWRVGIERCV